MSLLASFFADVLLLKNDLPKPLHQVLLCEEKSLYNPSEHGAQIDKFAKLQKKNLKRIIFKFLFAVLGFELMVARQMIYHLSHSISLKVSKKLSFVFKRHTILRFTSCYSSVCLNVAKNFSLCKHDHHSFKNLTHQKYASDLFSDFSYPVAHNSYS
jgi:hypothetical protein